MLEYLNTISLASKRETKSTNTMGELPQLLKEHEERSDKTEMQKTTPKSVRWELQQILGEQNLILT